MSGSWPGGDETGSGQDQEQPGSPSLWNHKPWWCQPWSIVATGVVVEAGSWWLLHRWWISSPLALGIGAWWWLFLVAVPRAYRQELEDDRAGA